MAMHFMLALLCALCFGHIGAGFFMPTLPTKPCEDKIPNCEEYMDGNMTVCTVYHQWAIDNCINSCGFCQGTPKPTPVCQDKLENCDDFGKDACTGIFTTWATEHCAKYCNLCSELGHYF